MDLNRWLDDYDKEFDAGVHREVMAKEYFHLLTLAGLYSYLQGRWRWLSLAHVTLINIIIAIHIFLLTRTCLIMIDINFALFNQVVHILIVLCLSLAVTFCAYRGRKFIATFHVFVKDGFFDYGEEDEIAWKIHDEMMKERKLLLFGPPMIVMTVGSVLVAAPMLDEFGTFNVKDINEPYLDFNVPIPMYYPFLRESQTVETVLTVLQLTCGLVTGLIVAGSGLAYVIMSQNLIKQYKIMVNKIRTTEERASNMFRSQYGVRPPSSKYDDPRYRQCYFLCLKKVYLHHLIIIKAIDDMAGLTRVPVFIVYSGGALVIGLSMITSTSGGELPGTASAGVFTCVLEVVYMFIFSIYGQRITDLGEDVRMSLYQTRWYLCDRRVKSALGVMQAATLNPFVLSLYGMFPTNLATFSSIINSAYSFYNLIIAMD